MLDYGKVTDTIYKRSVRKVIERNVPGAGDDRIGGRDILYFAADSDKAMLTASATLRQSAGSSRCGASGSQSSGSSRRLCAGCEYTVDRIRGITGEIHQSTDGIGF